MHNLVWYSMSSAPKDGSDILLAVRFAMIGQSTVLAHWYRKNWRYRYVGPNWYTLELDDIPLAWMPIPKYEDGPTLTTSTGTVGTSLI
jgi:hypothetical protein